MPEINEVDNIEIIELAASGQLVLLKMKISSGSYVNQTDRFGNCALLAAASRNDLEMLQALLEAGAIADVEDHFTNTALKWAQLHHNDEMRCLIETYIENQRSVSVKM